MDLKLESYQATEDVTVVKISGELDVYTCPRLRELILDLIGKGARRFVLEFGESVHLDSTGLGVLVTVLKRTRARCRGDETTVCIVTGDRSYVMRSLRLSRFTLLFPVYGDLNTAILSLYQEPFSAAVSSVDSESPELGEWPWFSARLFIPDRGAMADAENGFVDLIKSSGIIVVYASAGEDQAYREFVLRVENSSATLTREEVAALVRGLFERNAVLAPKRSDGVHSRALAALRTLLASVTEFIFQFDSSVLVKSNNSMIAYQLPRLQLKRYEADPKLFRDPVAALLKLREMQGLEGKVGPDGQRFLLFAGTSWYADSAVEKAESAGIAVRRNNLYSQPGGWNRVLSALGDPALMGAVVKLTPAIYKLIAYTDYRERAQQVLRAMSRIRHIIFVHEYLMADKDPVGQLIDTKNSSSHGATIGWKPSRFGIPTRDVRVEVNELMRQYGLNLITYKTNAEVSVLAARFIEENDRNLLFRVYVPADRLYAGETDRLISLFREWLNGVGKRGISEDSYQTAAGQVYEFFGNEALRYYEMAREFDMFSSFLEKCINDMGSAVEMLTNAGVKIKAAEKMVARYGKEMRRLQLDIRQERESRLLSIRHTLEAELLDCGTEVSRPSEQVNAIIEYLIPNTPESTSKNLLCPSPPTSAMPLTLNVNQQFVNAAQSTVLQNIQGRVNLGLAAKELLRVIDRFAGVEAPALESAVQEFDDPDARPADRLYARQRLKTFLLQVGGKIEDTVFVVLQKYLETKMLGK